jgi:hypothetical protein
MANLSITTACNRDCAYCFARTARFSPSGRPRHMSVELFARALDFIERSGIDRVRMLGGEPTLHPDFCQLFAMALARGKKVLIFSNALMPEHAVRAIEETPVSDVSVLVNLGDRENVEEDLRQRQRDVLRRLGPRTSISVNLDHPGVDLSFSLQWIREFGLAPSVRLGLAHPCIGSDTSWLRPRQYREAGRRLAAFASECKRIGVSIDWDCGFVPCMFPEGTMESLEIRGHEIGRRCNPILDVLCDGDVVSCYPLASLHHEPLTDTADAPALREAFQEALARYRPAGVFPECSTCTLRQQGDCSGGCLAAALARRRSNSACRDESRVEERVGARPGPRRLWVVPYIDQPLEFWQRLRADFGSDIRAVYLPLSQEGLGSGRPPQPSNHVAEFLKGGLFPANILVNPVILREPVERLAPRIVDALKRWYDEFGIMGVTVSNLLLALRIREAFPGLEIVASTLMDISTPAQSLMIDGVCDVLVPATRVVRSLPALRTLRRAFRGRIRLIVNEACLPGCPHRAQHFYEMAAGLDQPASLCQETLNRIPWLRLTGAWVLPQHLHLYDGLSDEFKLAGRVTLRDPARYRHVLGAYVHRSCLQPHEIGGGPASVLRPMNISEQFFRRLLDCPQNCTECNSCRAEYERDGEADQ